MSLYNISSFLAGFLFLFAFFPYVKAIVKGNASPKKATWLIWALNDIIVVAGMAAEGRFNGLIAGATIGATTVFFLSLRKGESGWKPLDIVCVCMSIVAIVASFLVDVNIGIALGLSSLFIAAVPTYYGGYMTLGFGALNSTWSLPDLETLDQRFRETCIKTKHYSPAMHLASFVLPPWIQDDINNTRKKKWEAA